MVELLKEFGLFLKHRKKFWLAPIIIVLLAVGAIIAGSAGALSPFIYALF
jgi:hypothetical protein